MDREIKRERECEGRKEGVSEGKRVAVKGQNELEDEAMCAGDSE